MVSSRVFDLLLLFVLQSLTRDTVPAPRAIESFHENVQFVPILFPISLIKLHFHLAQPLIDLWF